MRNAGPLTGVEVVVFDVGETLVSEERAWSEWADWIGVPRPAFFAALGATIALREDHRRVFEILAPGFDLAQEQRSRSAAGLGWRVTGKDLYPDALPCLGQLRAAGYRTAIAANQPARIQQDLADLGLPADFAATSGGWGVAKPAAAFFERIIAAAGVPAAKIAYVGDRLDNDVVPAVAAGMRAVFIRRGPWGHIQATWPEATLAHARVDSLRELAGHLRPPG